MNSMIDMGLFMFIIGIYHIFMGVYMYMLKMVIVFEWSILVFNGMDFSYMFYIDFMSNLFIGVVLMISCFVLIYSVDYMGGDKFLNRFNLLLEMFVLSMYLMVMSPSMLSILLGWDGLGLISYCLVVYYNSNSCYNSGMLTILCNRLGDVSMMMLIGLGMWIGSWNLMLYSLSFFMSFMLMLMMYTKSAQLPFSAWLPAAMTAPTPISALVHSSTLVAAGVYLMIRYNKMMVWEVKFVIMVISSVTMLMAGLMASFEHNLKKMIALSTLSQLGYMFILLSMDLINLGFFHLLVHALFKSLMFMCAGSILYEEGNSQDLRVCQGLISMSMFKCLMFIFSAMNLSGFPFFSGFYTKDMILEFYITSSVNKFIIIMVILSSVATLNYSVRMSKTVSESTTMCLVYRYSGTLMFMVCCKIFLFLFTLVGGYLFSQMFNHMVIMVTKLDKDFLSTFYFVSWWITWMFHNCNKSSIRNPRVYFLMMMFNSLFFFKILYLDVMLFTCSLDKDAEKFMDKMLDMSGKKMFFIQKFYPLINNWKYKLFLVDLMKFYVMLLLFFMYIN